MELFRVLKLAKKYEPRFINTLDRLFDKINNFDSKINYNKQDINLIEKDIIGIFNAADNIDDPIMLALSLCLLGFFYQKRAILNKIKLFSVLVNDEKYDDYLRAAFLFNLCWNIIEDKCFNQLKINDLNELYKKCQENLICQFLQLAGNVSELKNIIDRRNDLEDFLKKRRAESINLITTIKDIGKFYEETTENYKINIRKLVKSCVLAIEREQKHPNTIGDEENSQNKDKIEYSILGLGSVSRNEATPYSDIEFIILIEAHDKQYEHSKLLSTAIQLMNLVIISLNETPILSNLFEDNLFQKKLEAIKVKRGFAFDFSGRTALGKREFNDSKVSYKFKLLGDVGHIIKYMTHEGYLKDYRAQSEFDQFVVIEGENSDAAKNYEKRLKEYIMRESFYLAELLINNFKLFNFKRYQNKDSTSSRFSIHVENKKGLDNSIFLLAKHHIYRPLERLADALWLINFNKIPEEKRKFNISSIEKINVLQGNFIDKDTAEKIRYYLALALKLRLEIYSHYSYEQEALVVSDNIEDRHPLYILSQKNFLSERKLGEILVFIQQCFIQLNDLLEKKKINSSDNTIFKIENFNNDFKDLGDLKFKEEKYKYALKCYKHHCQLSTLEQEETKEKILECYLFQKKYQDIIDKISYHISSGEQNLYSKDNEVIKNVESITEKNIKYNLYLSLSNYGLSKLKDKAKLSLAKEYILKVINTCLRKYNIYTNEISKEDFIIKLNIADFNLTIGFFLYTKICYLLCDQIGPNKNEENNYIENVFIKALSCYKNLPDNEQDRVKKYLSFFIEESKKSEEGREESIINEINKTDYKTLCDKNETEKLFSRFTAIKENLNEKNNSCDRKFYGRKEECNKLKELLSQYNTVLVYGRRAIGKTAFIRHMVNEKFKQTHDIIWLNAKNKNILNVSHNETAFLHEYIGYGSYLSIEDITIKAFEDLLQRSIGKPIFIIYENVESIGDIKDLLPIINPNLINPNSENRFVISSQNNSFPNIPSLYIDVLSELDAGAFFEDNIDNNKYNEDERKTLLERSGYIPLNLVLLVAAKVDKNNIEAKKIEKNDSCICKCFEYLNENFKNELIVKSDNLDDTNKKELREKYNKYIITFLIKFAMMRTDYIESCIVDKIFEYGKKGKYEAKDIDIKNIIIQAHFMEEHKDGDETFYVMHSSIRDFILQKDNIILYIEDLSKELFDLYYHQRKKDVKIHVVLIPHLYSIINYVSNLLQDDPGSQVENSYALLSAMLSMFSHNIYVSKPQDLKRFTKALYEIEIKVTDDIKELYNGRNNSNRETANRYLFNLYKMQILRRAVGFSYFHNNNTFLARIYLYGAHTLALLYQCEFKKFLSFSPVEFDDASNYYKAIAYRDMAEILADTGLSQRALIFAKKSLSLLEKNDIECKKKQSYRLEIAVTLSIIGLCHYSLGEYHHAVEILKDSLKKKEKIFNVSKFRDRKHIEIAISESNLALAYSATGQIKYAKKILQEVSKYFLQRLGKTSSRYIDSISRLSLTYYSYCVNMSDSTLSKKKKYLFKAYKNCEKAINLYELHYPKNPNYIKTLLIFSEIKLYLFFLKINKSDIFNKQIIEKNYKKNISFLLQDTLFHENINNDNNTYIERYILKEVIDILLKARNLGFECFGEEYLAPVVFYHIPLSLFFSEETKWLTSNLKHYQEFFRRILSLSIQIYGDSHPIIARKYYDLGKIYYNNNSYEESISLFLKAVELLKEQNEPYDETIFPEEFWPYLSPKEEENKKDKKSAKNLSLKTLIKQAAISSMKMHYTHEALKNHSDILSNLEKAAYEAGDYYQFIFYAQRHITFIVNEMDYSIEDKAKKVAKIFKQISDAWLNIGFDHFALITLFTLFEKILLEALLNINNFEFDQTLQGEIKSSIDKVISCINRSDKKESIKENDNSQALISSSFAEVYYMSNNYDNAKEHLIKAIDALRNTEYHPYHTIFSAQLAKIDFANDNIDLALEKCKFSLYILRNNYHYSGWENPNIFSTYLLLVIIYLFKKNYILALYYMQKADKLGGSFKNIFNKKTNEKLYSLIKESFNDNDSFLIKKLTELFNKYLPNLPKDKKITFNTVALDYKDFPPSNEISLEEKICKIRIIFDEICMNEKTGDYDYKKRFYDKLNYMAKDLQYKLEANIENDRSLFYEVCRSGDISLLNKLSQILTKEELSKLLKKSTVFGWHPINLAAHINHYELVKWLVEKGAEVNVYTSEETRIICESDDLTSTRITFYNDTPLYFAVLNQNKNLVKFLLDNGARTDWSVNDGLSIFHICLAARLLEIDNEQVESEGPILADGILKLLFDSTSDDVLADLYNRSFGRFKRTLFAELINANAISFIKELFDPIEIINTSTDDKKKNKNEIVYKKKKYELFNINIFETYTHGRNILQIARSNDMRNLIYEEIKYQIYKNNKKIIVEPTNKTKEYKNEFLDFIGEYLIKKETNLYNCISTFIEKVVNTSDDLSILFWFRVLFHFIVKKLEQDFVSSIGKNEQFTKKYIVNIMFRLALSINDNNENCHRIVELILNNDNYFRELEFHNSFYGNNPFFDVVYGGNLSTLIMLQKFTIMRTGHAYNMCFEDYHNWTPLMIATWRDYRGSHKNIFNFLLGHSENNNNEIISDKTDIEKSTFHLNSAYLDHANNLQETALYLAVVANKSEFVKKLLDKDANPYPMINSLKYNTKKIKYRNYGYSTFFSNKYSNSDVINENYPSVLHAAAKAPDEKILENIVNVNKKINEDWLTFRTGRFLFTPIHVVMISRNAAKKVKHFEGRVESLLFTAHSRDPYDMILHNPEVGEKSKAENTDDRFREANKIYRSLFKHTKIENLTNVSKSKKRKRNDEERAREPTKIARTGTMDSKKISKNL